MLGFGGLIWLVVADRGLGVRRPPLRIVAATFAALWFVPGIIAYFVAWIIVPQEPSIVREAEVVRHPNEGTV